MLLVEFFFQKMIRLVLFKESKNCLLKKTYIVEKKAKNKRKMYFSRFSAFQTKE